MTLTMDREELVAVNDRSLEPLLRADGAAAERELERLLVTIARPLVATIIARGIRCPLGDDAADIAADVDLRLMMKLRAVAHDPAEAIQNFRSYVATLTYNAVNDYLRRRFPERTRLKKRLRYTLTTDRRFALWTTDAGPACGLRAWAGREDVLEPGSIDVKEDDDAIAAMFRAIGRPLLLDTLVDLIGFPTAPDEEPAPAVTTPLDVVADRNFARALWEEIRALPPMQRKALLLNLRYDGELDIISVLVLSDIATFADIAATLDVTEAVLASIWQELPWDDLRIAETLGVTRQQVINLRKAARTRLARRLPR